MIANDNIPRVTIVPAGMTLRQCLRAYWQRAFSVPPIFVAAALGMVRHATYFALAMLAHQAWGWIFLATFCWYTWCFLHRLGYYITLRVYQNVNMIAPPPPPLFPRIRIVD
jgi:hypothetical protein